MVQRQKLQSNGRLARCPCHTLHEWEIKDFLGRRGQTPHKATVSCRLCGRVIAIKE